jgi:hypothetical protein
MPLGRRGPRAEISHHQVCRCRRQYTSLALARRAVAAQEDRIENATHSKRGYSFVKAEASIPPPRRWRPSASPYVLPITRLDGAPYAISCTRPALVIDAKPLRYGLGMRSVFSGMAMGLLLVTGNVAAQRASLAEALFRDARRAMKAGDYALACPKLAESQRLDPSAGTLLNLAICEERQGNFATAWTKYRELLDTLPSSDPRREVATAHLLEIEQKLPRLNITVVGGSEDTVVRLNGVELQAASLGVDVPVDPGEHRLSVSIGRGRNLERTVRVSPGERLAVELAAPEKHEVTAPEAQSVPARRARKLPSAGGQSRPMALLAAPASDRDRALARGAYVAGGIGVVGLASAAVLTGLAFRQRSTVEDNCSDGVCRDERGPQAADEAGELLRMADAALVAGVVGVAVGGVLLWKSSNVGTGVRVRPGLGNVALAGELP